MINNWTHSLAHDAFMKQRFDDHLATDVKANKHAISCMGAYARDYSDSPLSTGCTEKLHQQLSNPWSK